MESQKPSGMKVKSLKGVRVLPEGAVRIDRMTRWGNPFKISESQDRETVIRLYRQHLWMMVQEEHISIEDLASLHGKDLYCWCAPLPCHGDVLVKAAAWAFQIVQEAEAEDEIRKSNPWDRSSEAGHHSTFIYL